MKKYQFKVGEEEEEFDLEDKDFLLITAIDNLSEQINNLRLAYGR